MESFAIEKWKFVIFIQFIKGRKNICKRRFKSIPFVRAAPCVISQTKMSECITTMVPQKLVGISERGEVKMSCNCLFKISCATSKSMSLNESYKRTNNRRSVINRYTGRQIQGRGRGYGSMRVRVRSITSDHKTDRCTPIETLLFVLMDCFHFPDLDLPPRLSNSIGVTHLLLEEQ